MGFVLPGGSRFCTGGSLTGCDPVCAGLCSASSVISCVAGHRFNSTLTGCVSISGVTLLLKLSSSALEIEPAGQL